MKSSAETDSKPSRFSISEHQLSIGLLALVLLLGSGYGIWSVVSPYFKHADQDQHGTSRLKAGLKLFEEKQWDQAIEVYREMLETDPDNGFAINLLGTASEIKWRNTWRTIRNADSKGLSELAVEQLKETEQQLLTDATENYRKLLDNARYRPRAYDRLASVYGFRFSQSDDKDDADQAIELLGEMISKGITTLRGIPQNEDLLSLKDHPDFPGLRAAEAQTSNFRGYEFPGTRTFIPSFRRRRNRYE